MKKVIAIILCAVTAASLIACGGNKTPEVPTEPKKDYSKFAGIVQDPKTWVEDFLALPIANENMTTDELRQLCVDAFKANLSFYWTPNKDITYTYKLQGKVADVKLPTGNAYSGLMYGTGLTDVGGTVGTIWKVLPYYDIETGVVDVEAMGEKYYGCLTSACSFGALQGWNRISNSHGIGGMGTYNQYDSNIIPVGPYKYEPYIYSSYFGSKTASNEIIAFNGDKVMYESYAAMLPADGLYSSSSWHVIMCSSKPVVVRNADGSINPTESYLLVCEQETSGTRDRNKPILQENGKYLRTLGMVDKKYTFTDLFMKGYIPFTFKEFLGQDPVEAGKAWIGDKITEIASGQDMTYQDLFTKSLLGNYVISNVEVTVKDASGKELMTYDPSVHTAPSTYQVSLKDCLIEEKLTPFVNGTNTIHIYARLANGELVEAFNTVLKSNG